MTRLIAVIGNLMTSPYLAVAFRLVLGTVFIAAGSSKIGHATEMVQTVLSYNILPTFLVRPFALTLPWVELISGVLLIVGLMTYSAGALLALVNLSFLIAIGTNLLRGANIDCGCFGPGEQLSWELFSRDVVLFLMSLQVFFARPSFLGLDWVVSRFRQEVISR